MNLILSNDKILDYSNVSGKYAYIRLYLPKFSLLYSYFQVISCRKRVENQVNSQVVAENAEFEKFDAHNAQKYLFFKYSYTI